MSPLHTAARIAPFRLGWELRRCAELLGYAVLYRPRGLREYDAERPQPPPVALRHLSRLSVFAEPPQASCHPPEPARSMPTPHS